MPAGVGGPVPADERPVAKPNQELEQSGRAIEVFRASAPCRREPAAELGRWTQAWRVAARECGARRISVAAPTGSDRGKPPGVGETPASYSSRQARDPPGADKAVAARV